MQRPSSLFTLRFRLHSNGSKTFSPVVGQPHSEDDVDVDDGQKDMNLETVNVSTYSSHRIPIGER